MKILVTGGAGFIGSALIRLLIRETTVEVVNVDKMTYAGNPESLADVSKDPRYRFELADIADGDAMRRIFARHRPDAVVHLAAESHVDRSIHGPGDFVHTNLVGTYTLLEAARTAWDQMPARSRERFRFLHVSTDEVYGDLAEASGAQPLFTEQTPYAPSSPYSASKAGSDHLVRAWHRTYGLPVLVTNCSNNYGPCQFPEKLVPLMILNGLKGLPLPVYGDGGQIRDWLYVEDHVRALWRVLNDGGVGETYNIGGWNEKTNLEVVHAICRELENLVPEKPAGVARYEDLITFIRDRPGHDRRYAIDASKIARELDWRPRETFETGLHKTLRWYLDNPEWVEHVQSGAYRKWLETHYA